MEDEQNNIRVPDDVFIGSTFQRSKDFALLAAALAAAQAEMKNPAKDQKAEVPMKSGGKYSYHYTDLASVMEAIRGPLTKNGIAVLQPVGIDRSRVMVTTLLAHKSGQWIQTDVVMIAGQDTPQGLGSAITYGRRYSLSALVGIAPADDDDGAAASQPGRQDRRYDQNDQPRQQPQQQQRQQPPQQLRPAATAPAPTTAQANSDHEKLLTAFTSLKASFADPAAYQSTLETFGVKDPRDFSSRPVAEAAYRALKIMAQKQPVNAPQPVAATNTAPSQGEAATASESANAQGSSAATEPYHATDDDLSAGFFNESTSNEPEITPLRVQDFDPDEYEYSFKLAKRTRSVNKARFNDLIQKFPGSKDAFIGMLETENKKRDAIEGIDGRAA
jgi:hypothetical protein